MGIFKCVGKIHNLLFIFEFVIIIFIGSDSKGITYYMIFGYKYPTNPTERM